MVVSYIGALLCASGGAVTYAGFRARGAVGGSAAERLRQSLKTPTLMLGLAMVLIGGFLVSWESG